jgi:hypothetical protein
MIVSFTLFPNMLDKLKLLDLKYWFNNSLTTYELF